MKWKAGSI